MMTALRRRQAELDEFIGDVAPNNFSADSKFLLRGDMRCVTKDVSLIRGALNDRRIPGGVVACVECLA